MNDASSFCKRKVICIRDSLRPRRLSFAILVSETGKFDQAPPDRPLALGLLVAFKTLWYHGYGPRLCPNLCLT